MRQKGLGASKKTSYFGGSRKKSCTDSNADLGRAKRDAKMRKLVVSSQAKTRENAREGP